MTTQAPRSQTVLNSLSDKVAVTGARFQGGDSQSLQVAIIKATNHEEVVPKEKHVRTLKQAVSGYSSRGQVVQIIQGLNERLKSTEWLVVLKTLMVFHRLFREADVTFLEEFCLLEKGRGILVKDNFTDAKAGTFDYSGFVRSFSLYLNQRKELYNAIRYDSDRDNSENSMVLGFPSEKILEAVPMLHKLLQRIVNSVPEGKAARNSVVQSAVIPLVRECLRVYRTAQEGLVKLIDVFFEMNATDAMKTVQIYREALELHERLLDYFQKVQSIPDLGNQVHMPNLQPLPSDFLTQMEDYVSSHQAANQPNQPSSSVQHHSKAPIRSKTMLNAVPVSAGTSVLSGGDNSQADNQHRNKVIQNVYKTNSDMMKMTLQSLDDLPDVSGEEGETKTPSPELDPFGDMDFKQVEDPTFSSTELNSGLTQNKNSFDPFDTFGDNPSDPFATNNAVTTNAPNNNNNNAFIQDPFQTFTDQPNQQQQQQKQQQQQIDPFFQEQSFSSGPFQTTNVQNVNGHAQNVDPFTQSAPFSQSNDPFGASNNFQVQFESVASNQFAQQNQQQVQQNNNNNNNNNQVTTQNPFATVNFSANSAPSSGPSSGSTTLRRKKDPLELLNEELGIINKEPPKPVIAMNQMKQMK